MRIRDLRIRRFGCFEEQKLDFTSGTANLHIIYGLNEAGKSTALRAITNFLYGIPGQCRDNFLYPYEEMRLIATLEKPDGTFATFIRKKGNRNTLLDENQNPLPDSVLADYLHGVQEKSFITMFGFDYQTLLRGREDLKEGKGDLAESLFQAGMGITGLRQILDGLQAEEAKLFSPSARATAPEINAGVDAYNAAAEKITKLSIRPRVWQEVKDDIERMESEFEEIKQTYEKRSAAMARYKRFHEALPLLSQRKAKVESLCGFDGTRMLSRSKVEEHEEARKKLHAASDRLDEMAGEKGDIESRWDDPKLIDRLLERQKQIASLHGRLEQFIGAKSDLPRVGSDQAVYEDEAKAILHRLGVEHALNNVAFACIEPTPRAAIAKFACEHFSASMPAEAILSGSVMDPSDLKRAMRLATEDGKIEQTAAAEQKKLDVLRENADKALKALALWSGTLEQVETLQVPLDATISRFEEDFHQLDTSIRDFGRDIARYNEDREGYKEQIDALQLTRLVPTEEELARDRERRQRGWALIRRAWLGGQSDSEAETEYDPEHPLPAAYEVSVSKADDTADRLRFEADRVARLAELTAALDRSDSKVGDLRKALQEIQKQRDQKSAEWCEAWNLTGIAEPLTPAEMREWIRDHERLVGLCRDIRDKEKVLACLQELIRTHSDSLFQELVAIGMQVVAHDEPLQVLIERSREALDTVTDLKELAGKVDQSDKAKIRAQKMEANVRAFEKDTGQLVKDLKVAELLGVEADEAARRIYDRLEKARTDKARISMLEGQEMRAREEKETAQNSLTALMSEAECENAEALETLVIASRDYRDLNVKLQDVDEKLAAYAAGATVEELVAETAEAEEDKLPGFIDGLRYELDELDRKRDDLRTRIGNRQNEIESMDHSAELADEVQKAQSASAEARSAAERYVRVHLASEILRTEIDRYRRENQGPVLALASELFPRLTLRSFEQVTTDTNEKGNQIIAGVRPNGRSVDVGGMSDGTRDQLYLALRLASLEQHVKSGTILPFIVDDILIEFDDDRARAALEILSEASGLTQILYFTHHGHVVEMAKQTLSASSLAVHDLGPPNAA